MCYCRIIKTFYSNPVCVLALVEYHKITCPTLQNMHFKYKNFHKKIGLKIRVVALPPDPTLFRDDFALNGVWRRDRRLQGIATRRFRASL